MTLITTTLTTAPDAPSRSDPANFSSKAGAYVAWQEESMVPELNALIAELNIVISEINANATAAQQAYDNVAAMGGATWWDNSTTYDQGDSVIGTNGFTYVSLIASNLNNNPVTDDGTNWAKVSGLGTFQPTSTSTSSNVTLISTSTNLQQITMTAQDKTVTLPDATELTTGLAFTIVNSGPYSFRILDDGGNFLSTLDPGLSAHCYLISHSTANGEWHIDGANKVSFSDPSVFNSSNSDYSLSTAVLSSTLAIVVYNDTTSSAIAINPQTGGALGSEFEFTTNDANNCQIVKLTANTAMIFYDDNTDSVCKAVVLSESSGTLSIPSGGGPTTVISDSVVDSYFIVGALSTSEVVISAYENNTTNMLRARVIQWNGTTISETGSVVTISSSDVSPSGLTVLDSSHFFVISSAKVVYSCSYSGGTISMDDSEDHSTDITLLQGTELLSDDATYFYCLYKNRLATSYSYFNTFKIAKSTGVITTIETDIPNITPGYHKIFLSLSDTVFIATSLLSSKEIYLTTYYWNESEETLVKIRDTKVFSSASASSNIWQLLRISDNQATSVIFNGDVGSLVSQLYNITGA